MFSELQPKKNQKKFNMSFILKMCFVVLLAFSVSVSVESAAVKREIETDNQSEIQAPPQTTTVKSTIRICETSMSCGWAIYANTITTREIKYFMKNACECPEGEHCVRVDDDPVVSAYVYKCRVKRTTIAPPTDDE